MGSVYLADDSELKVVTGIDDHARFVVCARMVARATASAVCEALRYALGEHGVPGQILTDNGKVFTGRFTAGKGRAASPSRLVMFDRILVENGITHLLTAPYSPTTTGKVERLHQTMRREFFDLHDRKWQTIEEAQAALDQWVKQYNTDRPHRSLGGRPPVERFSLAAQRVAAVDRTAGPLRRSAWARCAAACGGVAVGGSARADQAGQALLPSRRGVRRSVWF